MRYPLVLLAIVTALFAALAIAPPDRMTWALENSFLVAGIAFLFFTRRWLPLTNGAYSALFVFCVLHEIGAYYTYSNVPYESWYEALTGHPFSELFAWKRNHFDRFVHFSFGLLLAYPMRALFLRLVDARGVTSYFLPIQMVLSWSALYELIEWGAAMMFGEGTDIAYVGAQGDTWDAQKDMALAGVGAVLSMLLASAYHRARGCDKQRECVEALESCKWRLSSRG